MEAALAVGIILVVAVCASVNDAVLWLALVGSVLLIAVG